VQTILQSESDRERQILDRGQAYIQNLAKVETLSIVEKLDSAPEAIAGVVGTVQVLVLLAGVVDVAALKAKLEKDLKKVEAEIAALSGRLSNSKFVDKAPADVVQGARDALAEAEKQAEILKARLAQLQ
jgi:valyl-tRNA synthetase